MHALTRFINDARREKSILLMAHVVYGYPTIDASISLMREILSSGVELLEIQFPFSDPVADGEVITDACHTALNQRPKFSDYLDTLCHLADDYPNQRILMMGYLNPLIQHGVAQAAHTLAGKVAACIVPDLTIEQGHLLSPLTDAGVAPIWIVTPDTDTTRLTAIADNAHGFVYCMSQAGVTGQNRDTSAALAPYIERVAQHTSLPLGIGFGISKKSDVEAITGLADIAIVGSALLRAYKLAGEPLALANDFVKGNAAVGEKIKSLR